LGWFKVDDQLAFHSKTVMAGNTAMGLWVRAGAWASAQLTDGKVPKHMAKAMANPEDADALVMAGLWVDEGDDYRFHDWDVFQPSAAEEKRRREDISRKRSEAGRKGAQAKWEKERAAGKDGKPDGNTVTTDQQPESKPMAPSRPVPSRPEEETLLSDADAPDAEPGFSEDVIGLCDYLAEKVRENGNKAKVGKTWHQAMDRLMRLDGYTPDQVRQVIDWSQADEFWQGNIMSAAKLREKFDMLKTRMFNDRNRSNVRHMSASDHRLQRGLQMVQAALEEDEPDYRHPLEIQA
jgi:hypothetical protein